MTEQQEALLREAFNRRAIHSPRLEYRHPKIIDQTFAAMNVARSARALDIGCGSGWATRRLAKLAPDGPAASLLNWRTPSSPPDQRMKFPGKRISSRSFSVWIQRSSGRTPRRLFAR